MSGSGRSGNKGGMSGSSPRSDSESQIGRNAQSDDDLDRGSSNR
jgi:hypothetical protein